MQARLRLIILQVFALLIASNEVVAQGNGVTDPAEAPIAGGAATYAAFRKGFDRALVLPVVTDEPDAAHLLARLPGSFLYDLGANGWPHGWSPEGIDPAAIGLRVMGLSWNDPVMGRPRLDMLPVEFMMPLEVDGASFGQALGVETRLRHYDVERPATELRYRNGAAGLQAIAASHAQRRLIRPFGKESVFRIVGGYGGRASAGEYPGSRLRRERRVLGRLSLESGAFAASIVNLHGRRQIGAHGGVLPRPGFGIESVYERFGARVENERATRRSVRNDLLAEVRLPVIIAGGNPVVRGGWTASWFRYRDSADTLTSHTDRLAAQLLQSIDLGGISPDFFVEVGSQRSRMNWSDDRPSHAILHLAVRDTVRVGGIEFAAAAGVSREQSTSPTASAGLCYEPGILRLFGEASYGGVPTGLIHSHGFGPFLPAPEAAPTPHLSLLRGGVAVSRGPMEFSIAGFLHRMDDPILLRPQGGDTLAVTAVSGGVGRIGITVFAGLRTTAERGFYLSSEATLSRDASGERAPSEIADVVPAAFGTGRLGMRYRLFRGDLDLHAFGELRAWTEFRSRSFHAPTGLLVLPETNSVQPGPSSTLSLYLEAGVRDATLFVAWENVLAGTNLMHGNMLVPVYPLPERAFRFGVYWPIWD